VWVGDKLVSHKRMMFPDPADVVKAVRAEMTGTA